MKNYLTYFLFVSFLFIGCTEKNVDEPVIGDSELLSQIIGTWRSNNYIIIHSPDLTFIDTVFNQDSNTRLLRPLFSSSGKFEIHDGVLFLKAEQWKLFDSSFIENGISIVPLQAEISINGNILYKKPIIVLERTEGTGIEIWGSWKNMRWVYVTNPDANVIYTGREEYYYNFSKVLSHVTYGWKYLDGNPWPNPEFRSEFKYSPPYLSLYAPGDYNLKVEFKYEKMFWYLNNPIIELYKQH